MLATVNQFLSGVASDRDKAGLRPILDAGSNLDSSQGLTSAALAINATVTLVQTGAAFYAVANGILQNIPAATALPALVGSVLHGTFNVFCFYINSAGVVTSAMGSASTTLAGVGFPQLPPLQAMVGFIIIHPTGAGNFIGGTTGLSDATVIPNTVYISPTGSFDTSIIVG